MTRHDSRCTAVCLLFEYSFGGDRNEILENAANERGDEISAFAKSLYNGVIDNLEAVDETVRTAVLNRDESRIPRVVRSGARSHRNNRQRGGGDLSRIRRTRHDRLCPRRNRKNGQWISRS